MKKPIIKLLPRLLLSGLLLSICVAAGPYNPPIPPKPMVYPGAGVPMSTGSAWGTSYTVGTAANKLVQLNSSSQLPAVSGALLTHLPAGMVYPGAGIAISAGSSWGTSLTPPASAIVGISDTQTLSNKSFGSGMTWPTLNQSTTGAAGSVTGETFPASGLIVGTTDTQTLTNKTLTDSSNAFPANFVTTGGTQTITNKTLTSPTLTTPALGTPASGNLANCTFPTLNQSTTGAAGSVTGETFPASGLIVGTTDTQTLTNKTLTSPTLTTPALGTPASGNLANCTFPTLNQSTTGAAGSVTGETFPASGLIVGTTDTQTLTNKTLTSPTLTTPALGTPASGTLTNCTGPWQPLPINQYQLTGGTAMSAPSIGTAGAEWRYHVGTNGSGTNTGITAATTIPAPSGTAVDGQVGYITILSDSGSHSLTWNGAYLAGTTVSLPATTVASQELACGFRYDLVRGGWLLLAGAGGF
jgi:hypothetical protein